MTQLDKIGEDLFNKIRGRFPSVTIGDEDGNVTNEPSAARFFDFDYKTDSRTLGKVSVSISEDDGLTVIYSRDFIQNENEMTQNEWYNFLKELRVFSKKRMLDFSVRDINKSNLNKRDYQFLANRSGDDKMNESKLYGTHKVSYQKFDNARLVIKHTESINTESTGGRTQKIGAIYIESSEGERFKYPYRHLSGARAMARHVSEGGKPYDDFGKHITGLSEELNKLRKFKTYMGRSSVMAESLAGYMDIVKERISTVKKTIESLQKSAYYKEAVEGFESPVLEDVPADVAENWIDELTIKQFNEELADVFPYIYNLVKEGTKAKALGPADLDESGLQYYTGVKKHGKEYMKKAAEAGRKGASQEELGRLKDKYSKAEKKTKEEVELDEISSAARAAVALSAARRLDRRADRRASADNKEPEADVFKPSPKKDKGYSPMSGRVPRPHTTREEFEIEQTFEDIMGQFSDHVCEDCGNPSWRTLDEEKQKGVDGKVCWKGYKRMGTKMKGGRRVDNCVKVGEASDHNFTPDDLQQLQKMNNVDDVKRRAIELITTKSRKPMKPEKVAWFKRQIAGKRTPMDVIKLMYDLMLSGDGNAVIGSRGSMASNSYRRTFGEDDLEEAYINNAKDAIEILGNLRRIGKSIERGQGTYDGNLAGEYANDVYDVISWLQNNADTSDSNYQEVIGPVIELRKKAKSMEREPGSGKDARFGNEIVNTLYPLMQWIQMNAQGAKEGNAFAHAVRQAKMDGKKKGDKVQGPDGKEITLEKQKTPLGEFILSYFDRQTGQFPKGETAVLTMVEKDYGEEFIEPAKAFIEKINNLVAERFGFKEPDIQEDDVELNDISRLAGL